MAGVKIQAQRPRRGDRGQGQGQAGRVLRVIAEKNRVLVEHVMMVKKHVKPNPQKNIKGGIAEQEAPIHISNVMLIDSEGKRSRVGYQREGDTKVRIAKSNGQAIVSQEVRQSFAARSLIQRTTPRNGRRGSASEAQSGTVRKEKRLWHRD